MEINNQPIVTELIVENSLSAVWNAITDHSQMVEWYFENIPDFQAKIGFETQFVVQSSERQFTHIWKVTEVIPLQKIVYSWAYKEYTGLSYSSFELSDSEGKVKLVVSCTGLHTFPQELPEFSRASCQAGWNYFIQDRLKAYLNGL